MKILVIGKPSLSPAAGLLYAAAHSVYPVVGKFSFLVTEEDGKRHPHHASLYVLFSRASIELREKLVTAMRGLDWGQGKVVCDLPENPHTLLRQGKLGVVIYMQPCKTVDIYCDQFVLGRRVDEKGHVYMTIECVTINGERNE